MFKKRMNGILACLLAVLMLLAGCTQPDSPSSAAEPAASGAAESAASSAAEATTPAPSAAENAWTSAEGVNYPVEGDVTLTWFYPFDPNNYITDLSENTAIQKAMELTGVNLEFRHPVKNEEEQTLNLMMASGDLTDLIYRTDVYYDSGFDFGLREGLFADHDELLATYSPDYMKLVNSDPEALRQVTTDEGKIRGFCMLTNDTLGFDMLPLKTETASSGPGIRKDILDEIGMPIPETIADWDATLRAMKDHGVEIPLMQWNVVWTTDRDNSNAMFLSAYGIGPEFYMVGDEVRYGPQQPEIKQYLELMRGWYADGLIDREWTTRKKADADALIFDSENPLRVGAYSHETTAYILQSNNMGREMVSTPLPYLNDPSDIHWRESNNLSRGYDTVITTACENPEAAAMFMNFGYTDIGYQLYQYGQDGLNYDGFNDNGTPNYINEFKDEWDARRETFRLHNGSYLKTDPRSNPRGTALGGLLMSYREKWTEAGNDYVMPPFSLTADEGQESAAIMADIITMKEEMFAKFIMGTIPMSDFEDVWLPSIESMNIARACAVRQDAIARYYARDIG